ncbi:MAG: zinc-dependent metalloprotease family protein [Bacteroidota bacterium]
MKQIYLRTTLTLITTLIISSALAQSSSDGLWNKLLNTQVEGDKVNRSSFPSKYYLFQLNLTALQAQLVNAPVLFSGNPPLVLEFPNADGQYEKFNVYESSIMDPILEAKFPMIKTYAAQGIDDPTATMRFSVTQFGLHSMSLSGIKSTVFIDPYTSDLATYIVYDRAALGADPQTFACLTDDDVALPSIQKMSGDGNMTVQNINDQKLRTYRLAQSCTAEYGNIFAGTGTVAQQKANIQAQMTITMNRVNGVYERDLAIKMVFIPNNDLVIYLGSTAADPWSNEWNTKTAQTIDANIGVANYDIGHNFNTTGGGNAGCLSCVCMSTSQTGTHKGRGYTGRANPTGDAFDIDYVAHEMGHQFGGYHVMNTCSRSGNGTTEVEPASGSSIMGYAGICSSNVQANSHDDFNYVNVRDISNNIKTGNSSSCAAITTLTNSPPTASAGLDYTVPISTAYILEGTATDANGMSSLTYNWSQNDPTQSPGSAAPLSTYSVGPLYRSISPTISPNRYMPALATVISNTLNSTWEKTPSVARTMNFSFIVRDNHVGGGQTASDLMKVTTSAAAGPFSVTSQNTATTWTAATTQTITWAVAGTSVAPVSTPSVNIFLSTDGGYTYPITLASNVPNNGNRVITVPSVTTTTGRYMVRGAGNIFYDLNNGVLTIAPAPSAGPISNFSVASSNPCTSSSMQLTDQSLNAPTSWTWTATSSTGVTFSNANAQNPTVTFANAGTYTISLIAKNTSGQNTSIKTVTVIATPTVAVNSSTMCSGNSAVLTASGATTYNWSTSASTASISVSPATTTNYTVTGTSNGCTNTKVATVNVNTTPTVAVNNSTICSGNSAALTANGATTYSWSTSASTASISVSPATTTNYTVTGTSNGCTNTKVATVNVNATPTVAVNNSTICSGNSAALTANGATTYSWSTSALTASISVSPATTTSYTVTGTSNGCTNTKIATVNVNTAPTVAVNNSTICSGNSVALTASGATSYSWSTSASTASISVTPTITSSYVVTGTSNGCVNTKTATVTVNTLPNVAVSSATICSGSTGTLSASGASTYTWNTGATGASLPVSPASTTNYTVTGTSAAGCVKTSTASVTVGSAPSIAVNSPSICSGVTTTVTASGVTTYTWNTGSNNASISVSPTSTTIYTISGNLVGCGTTATNTVAVNVTANPTVSVNSTTICSGNSAALIASGATTYSWSTSASTTSISVSPATTTSYTVTGTSNGCVNSKIATVNVNTTPTVSVNSSTICSGNSAALTASGATSYSWSTSASTASISVSPATTTSYTVTGTSNGCTGSNVSNVVVKTTPTVSVNSSTICSGNSAVLMASGATSYSWSTSASTASVSVSPTTSISYTVTGTTNGCTNTKVSNVTVKTTPTVSVNSSTICSGNFAALTASGATTYSWSTSAPTASISVSPSSTTNYTVTGTTNGCTNTKVATVNVNTTPTVSVISSTICSGNFAALTASGATTYSWSTSASTASISVSPATTTSYTVTGTTNGCFDSQLATVSVNNLPNVTLSGLSGPLCINNAAVVLTGSPSGGTYSGAGVSGSNFDPAASGVGTFTVNYSYTDVNSCSAVASESVDVNTCTGITEATSSNSFIVYPNPTNGNFTIDFRSHTVENGSLEVFDAIGKLVLAEIISSNSTTISFNHFAKGIYSVRIKNNGSYFVTRVIKE